MDRAEVMYSGDLLFSKKLIGGIRSRKKHMDRAEAMYSGDLMFSMSLVWKRCIRKDC